MTGFQEREQAEEVAAQSRERELRVQEAARYVVQQHARLQDSEAALVASHGELDKAREGGHSRVASMLVQFAAAARRAVRHYRRLEDAGMVNLRTALGMSATATREEIGTAVPDAVDTAEATAATTSPGIATDNPTERGEEHHGTLPEGGRE